MKVAIAGGSGFIGSHLVRHFAERRNAEVTLVSRSPQTTDDSLARCVTWDQLREFPDLAEDLDAFVNLSGESINQRWTAAAKTRILQSRLETTGRVAELVARLRRKPKVVMNGSAMAIYGISDTDTFDEQCPARMTDFLAEVVHEWEKAADAIQGTRLIKLRVGLVLGRDGGALPRMALPYRLFVGGKVGGGRQWMSWIHIEDMVRLIDYCITHEEIEGPVNCTAPSPVRNDEFGRAIGGVLQRPHLFPAPAFMFRLLFGELSVLLLEGQRVIPRKLLDHGFTFQYGSVDEALRDLLRTAKSP